MTRVSLNPCTGVEFHPSSKHLAIFFPVKRKKIIEPEPHELNVHKAGMNKTANKTEKKGNKKRKGGILGRILGDGRDYKIVRYVTRRRIPHTILQVE